LFRPGQRVLDLGCHPGSWLQYCARAVGTRGLVVGVDTRRLALELPPHVHVLNADVFDLAPADLHQVGTVFDLVLSDLSPATTGIRSVDSARCARLVQRALVLAGDVLLPGGHFLGKVFLGSEFDAVVREAKRGFRRVRVMRPRAVRKQSKEVYLLARDKKG
jgi:23S rRNA (uridine2552-2'-O)-methyltransferase